MKKWCIFAAGAATLAGYANAQAASTEVLDAETGITFQSFTNDDGVSYRLALPANASTGGDFEVIIQLVVPISIGWSGWAFGGGMIYNPLTISWADGENVIVSGRQAYGYYQPEVYDGASYTVLKGTGVNATHFKLTTLCSGCTTWLDFDGNPTGLDGTGMANFAYAFSTAPVHTPSDPASDFSVHEAVGRWVHDLASARSADFDAWVTQNTPGGEAPNTTLPRVHARVPRSPRTVATPARLAARAGANSTVARAEGRFNGTTAARQERRPRVPDLRSAFRLNKGRGQEAGSPTNSTTSAANSK